MVHLTRKEQFNAAHRLYNPKWSEEKNIEIFGKCANPNFHGHNYDLYITVKGIPDPESGIIMNLKDLSSIIKTQIIEKLDHKNLDKDVEFIKGKISSAENLAKAIWIELKPHIKNCKLHCIKLCETERNFVEYYGE